LFNRTTEIDPNFAMAHASLGRMYADLDESDLAAESTARAWQLRGRASDREMFFITLGYETLVTGNLEAAQQSAASWAQTYPREARPHNVLSGMVNKTFGNYENVKSEARKASRSFEMTVRQWNGQPAGSEARTGCPAERRSPQHTPDTCGRRETCRAAP
jgi:hypothetical protein